MKRPSFQFYAGDWQGNAKLRRCSHAEKGMWIDVLCLMHDSPEYGVLRWPLKDIAQAIGAKLSDLHRIVEKGVLKGADQGERCAAYVHQGYHARRPLPPVTLVPEQEGPIWYSSRMVLDEYLRTRRGGSTKFTADNQPNRSPTGRLGDTARDDINRSPTGRLGDGASSSVLVPPIGPPSVNERLGENGKPKRGRQRLPKTPAPLTFEVTEELWAEAEAMGVPAEDIPIETEKFLNRNRAKGEMYSDWTAAWRNWMLKAVEFRKKAA